MQGTKVPLVFLREGMEHLGVSTKEGAGIELRVTSLKPNLADDLDDMDLSEAGLLFPEGRVRDERSLRLGLLYLFLHVIGTRLRRTLAVVS